jgi:hypothetical protein
VCGGEKNSCKLFGKFNFPSKLNIEQSFGTNVTNNCAGLKEIIFFISLINWKYKN